MRFLKIIILFFIFFPVLGVYAFDSTSILEEINRERERAGRQSLTTNKTLNDIAWKKAFSLANQGYLSHSPSMPEGEIWSLFSEAGYIYRYAGENLAVNIKNERELVSGWMNSPSHKKNILSENFGEVGIGIAYGNYMGEISTYVVAYFAQPKENEAKPISNQEERELRNMLTQLIALLNTYLSLLQKLP